MGLERERNDRDPYISLQDRVDTASEERATLCSQYTIP